jgi:hypothetical protein
MNILPVESLTYHYAKVICQTWARSDEISTEASLEDRRMDTTKDTRLDDRIDIEV